MRGEGARRRAAAEHSPARGRGTPSWPRPAAWARSRWARAPTAPCRSGPAPRRCPRRAPRRRRPWPWPPPAPPRALRSRPPGAPEPWAGDAAAARAAAARRRAAALPAAGRRKRCVGPWWNWFGAGGGGGDERGVSTSASRRRRRRRRWMQIEHGLVTVQKTERFHALCRRDARRERGGAVSGSDSRHARHMCHAARSTGLPDNPTCAWRATMRAWPRRSPPESPPAIWSRRSRGVSGRGYHFYSVKVNTAGWSCRPPAPRIPAAPSRLSVGST